MRVLAAAAVLFLAGCLSDGPSDSATHPNARRLGGASGDFPSAPSPLSNVTEYRAPDIGGPWAVALWLEAEATLGCRATLESAAASQGGTADVILMLARGWDRPEVLGVPYHTFQRGDGYIAHATVAGASQDVRDPAAGLSRTASLAHAQLAFPLHPQALVVAGNSYMLYREGSDFPTMRLAIECDGLFRVVHRSEGTTLRVAGAEEFNGGTQVDTAAGIAVQQGIEKRVAIGAGLVGLLHEDANRGNATYTTTFPDGSTQVDRLGNRIVVGPPGEWRFGLDRTSLSPGGEFRLFLFDGVVPSFAESPVGTGPSIVK